MGSGHLFGWESVGEDWVKVLANPSGELLIDASLILEDVPTDGELEKAPTSNWAYDHANETDVHPTLDDLNITGNLGLNAAVPIRQIQINQIADSCILIYGFDDMSAKWGQLYLDAAGFMNLNVSERFQFRVASALIAQTIPYRGGGSLDIYSSPSLTSYLTFGNGKIGLTYNDQVSDKLELADKDGNVFMSVDDVGGVADFVFNNSIECVVITMGADLVCTEDEADSKITIHTAVAAAHHEKYTDANAQAACNLDGDLYYSMAGTNFRPTNPDVDDHHYGVAGILTSDRDGMSVYAPVMLPDGATVTACLVDGTDGLNDEYWSLYQIAHSDQTVLLMGQATVQTEDTSISNDVIDNSLYSYIIAVVSMDTTDILHYARIKYTL
ncbi:hypothetical protein LCGC14_1304460 [marine sediment metagenome]|uniref:Uncharacterized protein n=1 Tax=marine sediment metagenome TaxID=412755 RepID=A0A0F9KPT3_9ZZZZ